MSSNSILHPGTVRLLALLLLSLLASKTPTYASGSTAQWVPDASHAETPLIVSSLLVNTGAGTKLWIGGNFDSIGPSTGRAAWVNPTTGLLDRSFPKVAATIVTAFAAENTASSGADQNGWYVAGESTAADQVGFHKGFVELVKSDGTVDTTFKVTTDRTVRALAVLGSNVIVSGEFEHINGVRRAGIAMVTSTGAVTTWDPQLKFDSGAQPDVDSVALKGNTIYLAGGSITGAAGANTGPLLGVSATNAKVVWQPSIPLYFAFAVAVEGSRVFASVGHRENEQDVDSYDATSGALLWSKPTQSLVEAFAFKVDSLLYLGASGPVFDTGNRSPVVTVDLATGNLDTTFNAVPNSSVTSLALQGQTLYLGGVFDSVNGVSRSRAASVNATTGHLTNWNPRAGNEVLTLLASKTEILLGGFFSAVNTIPRNLMAEVDPITGEPTDFDPNPNGTPTAMASDGTTVYLTGGFDVILGQGRQYSAGISIANHKLTPFAPIGSDTLDQESIAVDDTNVYVGGQWDYLIQGSKDIPYVNLVAFDKSTGALRKNFAPQPSYTVQSLLVLNGNIYAGGQFQQIGGVTRNGAAALTSAGAVTSFNPNIGDISGGTIVNFAYDALDKQLVLAGDFQSVHGQTRTNLAMVDPATGIPNSWAPSTNGPIDDVLVDSANGDVYIGGIFSTVNGVARSDAAVFNAGGQLTGNVINTDGEVHTLQLYRPATESAVLDLAGAFSLINRSFSESFGAIDLP